MPQEARRPAPPGDTGGYRASDACLAGPLDSAEDSQIPQNFQSFGEIASWIVARIAARHHLTASQAAAIAELAGLGGASS